MYIKTTGKPSKLDLKLCKDALKFYGRLLLRESTYNKILIKLEFDKELSRANEYAFCFYEEDLESEYKTFIITIDPQLGKRNMLKALAHEMVHVKQYAKGELKDYVRTNKIKWCGKVILHEKLNYWDTPWEIEAHGREKGLYFRFLDDQELKKYHRKNRKK